MTKKEKLKLAKQALESTSRALDGLLLLLAHGHLTIVHKTLLHMKTRHKEVLERLE